MNQDERKEVAKALFLTTKYYGKELDREIMSMMLDDLDAYSCASVLGALDAYRKNPRNRSAPLPAHLIEIMSPAPESRDVANEIAQDILRCVRRHGRNWQSLCYRGGFESYDGKGGRSFPTWSEAAVSEFGELGLEVVRRRGGWGFVCDDADHMDNAAFIAQLRDQIQSAVTLARQGVRSSDLALPPASGDTKVLQLIAAASRNLPE